MNQPRPRRLTALALSALLYLSPAAASPRPVSAAQSSAELLAALPPSDAVSLIDFKRVFAEVVPSLLADQPGPRDQLDRDLDEARALTGFDPRTMGRVATGFRFADPAAGKEQPGSAWVSVTQGVDYGGWLASMRQRRPAALSDSTHAGKTLHVLRLDAKEREKVEAVALTPLSGSEVAVAALGAGTLAFGTPAEVRRAVDAAAAGAPGVSADLVAAATRSPQAIFSMAGLMPRGLIAAIISGTRQEGSEFDKMLSSLKQFSAAVELTAGGFALTLTGGVGSAEQSKTIGDVLTALKTLAGVSTPKNARDRLMLEVVKGVTVSTAGAAVHVKADLAQATATRLVGRLLADNYNARGLAHRNKEEFDAAIADFDKAIALAPDSAAAYVNRAWARHRKGDSAAASADFDKAAALEPESATVYNNRGYARLEKKDYDAAIADFDKAIALDPSFAYAYNNRGQARASKGDFGEALDDFDRSLAFDSKNVLAYLNRGFARYMTGDLDRAAADYEKAIALDANSAAAYSGRGYARTDKGDCDAAITDFDKAIALDPKFADAYHGRARARYCKDELDAALADYDRAIAHDPGVAVVYSNRGYARIEKEDFNAALADFDKAIALDPKMDEAFHGRGLVRYRQQDFVQAINEFGKVIAVNPDHAAAYGYRALSLLWLGRDDEAARDLKKCFGLDEALQFEFEILAEEVRESRRTKPGRAH